MFAPIVSAIVPAMSGLSAFAAPAIKAGAKEAIKQAAMLGTGAAIVATGYVGFKSAKWTINKAARAVVLMTQEKANTNPLHVAPPARGTPPVNDDGDLYQDAAE